MKAFEGDVVIGSGKGPPEGGAFALEAGRGLAGQAPSARPQLRCDPLTVARVGERLRRRHGQAQAHFGVGIPGLQRAAAPLAQRQHARQIGIEIEVRAKRADVARPGERAGPRRGGEEHAAAD